MAHPEIFLSELQRVGKAGYIKTPNALFERLHPYNIHCLEIVKTGDMLHIYKKNSLFTIHSFALEIFFLPPHLWVN